MHFGLTATDLATHQYRDCELELRLKHDKQYDDSQRSQSKPDELSAALFARGNKWENHLRQILDSSLLVLDFDSDVESLDLFQPVVEDTRPTFFITGLCFPENNLFGTALRRSKPDFVRVEKTGSNINFTIIDAKISHEVKVSHQVQIAVYALILRKLINSKYPDKSMYVNDTAYVWLSPPRGVTWPSEINSLFNEKSSFSLQLIIPLVERMLNVSVPRIFSSHVEALEWGVGKRCDGCEFEEGCVARAKIEGDLGLVGGTKGRDRAALKGFIKSFKEFRAQNLEPAVIKETNLEIPSANNWNEDWKRMKEIGVGSVNPLQTDIRVIQSALKESAFIAEFAAKNVASWTAISRILRIPRSGSRSPIIDSAINNSVELINEPYSGFPRHYEHAVFISVIRDPESDEVFGISVLHQKYRDFIAVEPDSTTFSKTFISPEQSLSDATFVRDFTNHLKALVLELQKANCAQFFVFSAADKDDIVQLLIKEAQQYDSVALSDASTCIEAIVEHPNVLLASIFPPLLLSKLSLVGTKVPRLKIDLQWYLQAIEGGQNLVNATVSTLKERVAQVIDDGLEMSLIPRIVAVSEVLENLIAMPVPRVTLMGSASLLINKKEVRTKEEVFSTWKSGNTETAAKMLENWNHANAAICVEIHRRLSANGDIDRILPSVLSNFQVLRLDICRDPILSRLAFISQVEMIKDWQVIKDARYKSESAAELEFYSTGNRDEFNFKVHSGISMIQSKFDHTDDFKRYDFILVDSLENNAPHFNDLLHMNQAYTNLKLTDNEIKEFGQSIAFAHVLNIRENIVTLHVKSSCGSTFPTKEGPKMFKLYPRFIDFNTQKVIRGLIDTEVLRLQRSAMRKPPPLFLSLLSGEFSIAEPYAKEIALKNESALFRTYQELYNLRNFDSRDRLLHFLPSQHSAFKAVLGNVVTVIWGPPGNGKTHTLALACIRLIEIAARCEKNCRIMMTAFTHAAIDTFENKVSELIAHRAGEIFDNIENSKWLQQIQILNLKNKEKPSKKPYSITVGTVWAISKLFEGASEFRGYFDVLLIDEGSQFLASYAAIAIQAIDVIDMSSKKLIVAGDQKQLGPILKGTYPKPDESRPIYGSILDCLMYQNDANVVVLKSNFRFVKPLCKFTERLYVHSKDSFEPMKGTQTMVSNSIRSWFVDHEASDWAEKTVQKIGGTSMATIILDGKNASEEALLLEAHIQREVMIVTGLVKVFDQCVPEASIFVITPHRLQRMHMTASFASFQMNSSSKLRIDTVERMQGKQADIVVVCYGFTSHTATFENELDFVYDIRRINVALSRSKALCVLVASRNLFQPPISALAKLASRQGLDHLSQFNKSSLQIVWDSDGVAGLSAVLDQLHVHE
ncbi:Tripartite DNA replication factor [Entophlyctis luteolus]|nr:Tripartite DNA replication factor [Entophlyctis luteolus]KAJ3349020.1 Tripartite DNA replication factor [Entophlyctis luteolus]KAJ3390985.1 Tripartite DNA replication factor [Entophlyctis sp. JEL0112]